MKPWSKTSAFRVIIPFLLLLGILFFIPQCKPGSGQKQLNVLVISGGHGYDTAEFEWMFESMPGLSIEFELKPEAWKRMEEDRGYDALVFYDMFQEISQEEKEIFLAEFEKGTGMVFLHHSLGSHQDWSGYAELVGGKFYIEDYTADTNLILGYTHDITLDVKIIDTLHAVTMGVKDYQVVDEGYTNCELLPGLNYLLETIHPQCDRYIGWTHSYGNSRVVYLMGGHDKQAFENKAFARLVENSIRWTAAK